MPKISILTAVAPSDVKHLDETYKSLVSQDLSDWQWILVADSDTPLLKDCFTEDHRVVTTHTGQSRLGPAAARNLGSGLVESPVIRNLDADDLLADDTVLSRTVRVFDQQPSVAFAGGSCVDFTEDGEHIFWDDPLKEGIIPEGFLYLFWERHKVNALHPTTLSVRTDVFFCVGGYPALPAAEDTSLMFVLNQRHAGWFDPKPVTLYRKHNGSITTTDWYADTAARDLRMKFAQRIGMSINSGHHQD